MVFYCPKIKMPSKKFDFFFDMYVDKVRYIFYFFKRIVLQSRHFFALYSFGGVDNSLEEMYTQTVYQFNAKINSSTVSDIQDRKLLTELEYQAK